MGLPGDSDYKESACSSGDPVSIPGLGRSPGEGNGGYSLQNSFLENPMDRSLEGYRLARTPSLYQEEKDD